VMKKNKLLLIGWDAADWKIIGPLIAKGQMPSLKKMIDNGVYGNMSTMNPPYSPMLWSSVATGKTPDKHGVLGFIEVSPERKIRPVTANSRKSRAVWNILHNQGYKSNLVGWWPSFPAEPINGVVVSDKFQKLGVNPNKIPKIPERAIHPQNMIDKLRGLKMFSNEITKEHILPFIPKAAKIDQESEKNGIPNFSLIMAESVSIHNAATYLLSETDWDFMAVYYDMIDHFCHSFMKYHPPRLPKIDPESYDIYKDVVNSSYRFQDMMLGRMLEMVDKDTTVIVMSDHGFESGYKRLVTMPKINAAPALDHRQFGIFVAMGPNIKKNEKIFGLSLIDVAPTLLNHFNLPVGNDMDGKVILDMYENIVPPKFIDSWETIEGDFGELDKEENNAFSDEETIEQLIELGYIEKPDDKIEIAVHKTKCDLKHNLAKVYLGKKDFESAKEILLELIEEKDPIDIAPYCIDLMNVYIKLEDFESAEMLLEDFEKVKTEIKFNTSFIETDILLGKGNNNEAKKKLIETIKKKPSSEAYYRLGEIYKFQNAYENAKEAYENAIAIEPDKAKFHKSMAEVFYDLKEYETAAEYAFTSIELVKYYPAAHYILGRSLEKLGDLENAKLAYETAERLQPRNYERSKIARENIEELLALPKDKIEKQQFKYRKEQIVVVSGLPRSGTSLMMQMLTKGGSTILTDENRKADKSNPKGYYEYDPVMSIHKDNSWLGNAKDKSIKIVAPLLKYLDPKYRYKVIFMTRDLNEVIKSQQIMTGKDPDTLPLKLLESYHKLLNTVELWENNEPGVEMIYVNYKDTLDNPSEVLDRVITFVGEDLDKQSMIGCVDKKLYRNRSEVTSYN